MATQAQILEAAKKLKEAASSAEVDPAELTNIAALLEEAKVVEGDGKKKSDEEMTEAEKEEARKKEASKGKGGKIDNLDDNNGNEDDEGSDGAADDAGGKKQKESTGNGKGSLLEGEADDDIKKKYPSIFAAALREAQRTGGSSDDAEKQKLLRENAEFRAERDLRESHDLARKVLRESNLPEAAYRRTLSQMIGHTESEMRSIVADEEQFLESIGVTKTETKRVAGNGSRVQVRESDVTKNTRALMAGVAAVED